MVLAFDTGHEVRRGTPETQWPSEECPERWWVETTHDEVWLAQWQKSVAYRENIGQQHELLHGNSKTVSLFQLIRDLHSYKIMLS